MCQRVSFRIRIKDVNFTLQLDAAAPVLATLKEPIVIAKVDADKHTKLARKYDVEYVLCHLCYLLRTFLFFPKLI